ncbi:MAG: hypothetical protein FWF46_08145 [Oscillospiraceae bacterium]|nr:hypothetical protein [Oscillospiraceae bacterium]
MSSKTIEMIYLNMVMMLNIMIFHHMNTLTGGKIHRKVKGLHYIMSMMKIMRIKEKGSNISLQPAGHLGGETS